MTNEHELFISTTGFAWNKLPGFAEGERERASGVTMVARERIKSSKGRE